MRLKFVANTVLRKIKNMNKNRILNTAKINLNTPPPWSTFLADIRGAIYSTFKNYQKKVEFNVFYLERFFLGKPTSTKFYR